MFVPTPTILGRPSQASFVVFLYSPTSVENYGSNFGCDVNTGYEFNQICYGSQTLTAANWGTASPEVSFGETFQDILGAFASNVAPGENTINWYDAVDGDLQPGDVAADNFFLFEALQPQSIGIALFSNGSSATSIPVTTATPGGGGGGGNANVPTPASALLLLAGIAGLGLRRKARRG